MAQGAVESGTIDWFVEWLYNAQKKLQNLIIREQMPYEMEMALAESLVVSYLTLVIKVREYIETIEKKVNINDLNDFGKKPWEISNRYYNYSDVKKLCDGINVEYKLEGKRITPEWYIKQIIYKHCFDDLVQMHNNIAVIVTRHIPELVDQLFNNKKNAGAMIVYAKYNEVRVKLHSLNTIFEEKFTLLSTFHKEKTIIWQEKPQGDIVEQFDKLYNEMVTNWCKCTSVFLRDHWDVYDQYPDIEGACVTYLCEMLVEELANNNYDAFSKNYKNLLESLLLYQEYSREKLLKIKEVYRQEAVFRVFTNPIIEYCMISGYAYLFGEISGDKRWENLILEDAKSYFSQDGLGKNVCRMLKAVQNQPVAIYNRDPLHISWCDRIEDAFKKHPNLLWKEDTYYKVYDGESNLLKKVLNDYEDMDFLNCKAFEVYAIVVLNQFLGNEEQFKSRSGWENEFYE